MSRPARAAQAAPGASAWLRVPPIGEALPCSSLDREAGALGIIDPELDAVGIAEIELGEIAVKVLLAAMLIDASHSAFED